MTKTQTCYLLTVSQKLQELNPQVHGAKSGESVKTSVSGKCETSCTWCGFFPPRFSQSDSICRCVLHIPFFPLNFLKDTVPFPFVFCTLWLCESGIMMSKQKKKNSNHIPDVFPKIYKPVRQKMANHWCGLWLD